MSDRFRDEPTRFWELEPPTWRIVIETNVTGPLLMARAVLPQMLRGGWGCTVNFSRDYSTMRRARFSPYGPSKAALESATIIWAQDLRATGVTVNALLPLGASRTGIIPQAVPGSVRDQLLDPAIRVAPLHWLIGSAADGLSGCRINARRWDPTQPLAAIETAG